MTTLLERLINEDFGLNSGGRYRKSIKHDSLVYDSERDIFFWNSKGIYGDILDYLIKVRGYSKNRAERFIKAEKGNPYLEFVRISNERPSKQVAESLHKNLLKTGKFEYFRKRGINYRTIIEYRLGYKRDRGIDWFSVPVFYGEELCNLQLRTDRLPQLGGRKLVYKQWKTGKPCVLHKFLLSYSKDVFVVEGILDSILLSQFGFLTLSSDSGLDFFKVIRQQLIGKNIYIIQDNDKAGFMAAKLWIKEFGKEFVRLFNWRVLQNASDGEDVISLYQKLKDKKIILELFMEKNNYV